MKQTLLYRKVVLMGSAILALVGPSALAIQPKPRDDGHIAGSLVDLLDQDGWEQPTVDMKSDVTQEPAAAPFGEGDGRGSAAEPRPVVNQAPAAPPPNAVAELNQLIAKRHAIVDGCGFFQLIDKTLKAEQTFMGAKARLVAANGAIQRATTDINIARVQKNEGMESRALSNLEAAKRAVLEADGDTKRAWREYQALWGQLGPKIKDFLDIYRAMRQFVVSDRASPRLVAARDTFNRACEQRGDFHEGRVLAALCEVYAGGAVAAEQHLKQGAFFGQELFFAWPPASDMCLAYLLVGKPNAVDPWVKWVKGIDEKRKTPTRCWLVAMQGAMECKDNLAKEWFDRCGRRINATAKKQNRPPVIPPEVAGEWAFFLMTCPNAKFRDLAKAKELLGNLVPDASWHVARAAAAVTAEEGQWEDARRDAALAAKHGPVVLSNEFNEQVTAYENRQPWMRSRPVNN